MGLINWSDSEEMVGLLIEYVADERQLCIRDASRSEFLSRLLRDLRDFEESLEGMSPDAQIEKIRTIRESLSSDFAGDDVIGHLDACIEELQRINLSTRRR
jgi:hypothetical protein